MNLANEDIRFKNLFSQDGACPFASISQYSMHLIPVCICMELWIHFNRKSG